MSEAPRTVTFPARGWAALAIFGVLMIGLLTTQLVVLFEQRALIDHQESIAERQAERTLPILRTVDGLLGDGDTLRREAARAGALVRELRRADLPELAGLVADVLPVLRRLPGLAATVERSADVLGRSYVTQRRVLGRTGTAVRLQREAVALQRASLRVQRETLAIQREVLGVARRTMVAAEEAAARARSIDRKTGGSAPAGSGAAGGLLP